MYHSQDCSSIEGGNGTRLSARDDRTQGAKKAVIAIGVWDVAANILNYLGVPGEATRRHDQKSKAEKELASLME